MRRAWLLLAILARGSDACPVAALPLALAACHPAPPLRPPRSDTPPIYQACPETMPLPHAGDVCLGQFTREGLSCVRCAELACFDAKDGVWCAAGPCAADPQCSLRSGPLGTLGRGRDHVRASGGAP